MYPQVLCLTSFLFTSPVFLSNKTNTLTSFILLSTSLASMTFWSHPVAFRNTWIHKVDGFFARSAIATIILKQMVEPRNPGLFAISTGAMLYWFRISSIHSEMEWCCDKHISSHTMAHLYAIVSLWYAYR
jgi:hypothetical protein